MNYQGFRIPYIGQMAGDFDIFDKGLASSTTALHTAGNDRARTFRQQTLNHLMIWMIWQSAALSMAISKWRSAVI